jgi:hypothetical protein
MTWGSACSMTITCLLSTTLVSTFICSVDFSVPLS